VRINEICKRSAKLGSVGEKREFLADKVHRYTRKFCKRPPPQPSRGEGSKTENPDMYVRVFCFGKILFLNPQSEFLIPKFKKAPLHGRDWGGLYSSFLLPSGWYMYRKV
jgi:hypothetical protein